MSYIINPDGTVGGDRPNPLQMQKQIAIEKGGIIGGLATGILVNKK